MCVVYRQCDRKGPAWVVFLVFSISNLISNDTICILKKNNNETPLSQRVQFLRKKTLQKYTTYCCAFKCCPKYHFQIFKM